MSAVTAGKPCVPFPQSSEAISYQPFYGKFATTGQSQAAGESEHGSERAAKKKPGRGRGRGKGGGGPAAGTPPAKAPSAPSPPGGPPTERTGGASPR
jgi:hypothetical protein